MYIVLSCKRSANFTFVFIVHFDHDELNSRWLPVLVSIDFDLSSYEKRDETQKFVTLLHLKGAYNVKLAI